MNTHIAFRILQNLQVFNKGTETRLLFSMLEHQDFDFKSYPEPQREIELGLHLIISNLELLELDFESQLYKLENFSSFDLDQISGKIIEEIKPTNEIKCSYASTFFHALRIKLANKMKAETKALRDNIIEIFLEKYELPARILEKSYCRDIKEFLDYHGVNLIHATYDLDPKDGLEKNIELLSRKIEKFIDDHMSLALIELIEIRLRKLFPNGLSDLKQYDYNHLSKILAVLSNDCA